MIAAASIERTQNAEPIFVTRVRLRAQRRILWMNKIWSPQLTEGAGGLAITPAEVAQILMSPEDRAAAEKSFYLEDAEARQLSAEINDLECASRDESCERLRKSFDLSGPEVDLLSLIVAADFNPSFLRAYGYLHDDASACYATQWLASTLFEWPQSSAVHTESNLLKWRLAFPFEGYKNPWASNVPWAADPFVTSFLSSGVEIDEAISQGIEIVRSAELKEKIFLYPKEQAAIQSFVSAIRDHNQTEGKVSTEAPGTVIEIIGSPGAGKRVLAAQVCATLGSEMISADAGILANGDAAMVRQSMIRVARLACLKNATVYWHNTEGLSPQNLKGVAAGRDLVILGGESPLPQSSGDDAARMIVRLPRLTRASRLALWKSLTDEPAPEPVSNWMLSPAEIVRAALVTPAGLNAVAEACRHMLYQTPGELFTPLVCPYAWDDIVLTETVRRHLNELEEQARHRRVIYEDWGFAKLCPVGQGITALFAGPSGTGKTMAAQVLARSLDLELYRVDLAGVVNKYIGETEKRLKRVFDSCERANVLLFFDEADALFGQRTQVKDAHDRFANIEIDYLLQRMEQFDGLAVLATNRKNDIDKAFLRRLRFIIDFLDPGPVERLALWHHALLEKTPDGQPLLDEINWEFLANRLAMTGADIKSAALAAAFLARAEGCRIGMRHVIEAAGRELKKHGVVLRAGDLN